MLTQNFKLKDALGEAFCPRCAAKGIDEVTSDEAESVPHADRHIPRFYVQPSVYAKCSACGLVMEWPGCSG